jgi:transposase-like protein
MICPHCDSKNLEKIDTAMYGQVQRYRCRDCGGTFRHDKRGMPSAEEQKFDLKARKHSDPYKSFTRGINRDLIDRRVK